MDLPAARSLRLTLDEAGFKKIYSEFPIVKWGKFTAMVDEPIFRTELTIKWDKKTITAKIGVNATLAEAELAIKAIKDPALAPALIGLEWATKLVEELLKEKI